MSSSGQSAVTTHRGKIAAGGGLAAGVALAMTLLPHFEGERTKAYLDPVGIPTICYGETAGVKLGQTATQPECLSMLDRDVQARVPAMQKCLKVPVSPQTAAAMISFGYNVGTGTYCSKIAPLANAGKTAAACDRMGLYTYAGGKQLPGLVARRKAEVALCLKGLS